MRLIRVKFVLVNLNPINDTYIPHLNIDIKLTKILYYSLLLLDRFRFCEIYFTTYQRFVADQSAISPFLGGFD